MKVTIPAATTNETEQPFTVEQLEKLAASAEGKPVLMDFDPEKVIGEIESAEVVDDKLIITADVLAECSGKYLVPGYRRPEYVSVAYGITDKPQDQTLIKI